MSISFSPRATFAHELAALVEKFARNRGEYMAQAYSESQARLDFIDPLFEALGWDVRNRAQRAEREREVVVERGPTSGRPDYNFRMEGRTLFYVEAKAPHVPLDQSSVILQAKRYAFGDTEQEVNFAAATDFEEFRFYDAHKKPDPRNPNEGLLFAYRYDQYLDADTLENLWQLSREQIAVGSLDKWLTPAARRERQRAPLDQQFLADLQKWRESLAKGIFRVNPTLDAADLNRVTQILLDRLIFIRVAEDRGVLEFGQVREIAREWREERARPITTRLFALFREVNRHLNGEIFKATLPEQLQWDATLSKLLAEIILDGLEAYSFFKMPVELLGSIYERYLGKTLRIAGRGIKLEDKPEVRKAGGVYYTPKYVVDYIVEQTVGQLVEGKSPKELAKLKILDPACGSGSFLLGAYQKLLDVLVERRQTADGRQRGIVDDAQPALLDDSALRETRLSFQDKAAILKNNLFGVDLDPQAVEITMMSLYIKLLEGERGLLTGQGVLPRLNENILCGNSLIGFDIGELSDAERERINPFDWASPRTGFGEIMASGGFDAVVGNPPYGATYGKPEEKYFRNTFAVFGEIKDVYACFIEQGIKKLSVNGKFSYIVPSAWLGGPAYHSLREFVLQYQVEFVILLPFDVFADAYVDTAILVVAKRKPESTNRVKTFTFDKRAKLSTIQLRESEYHLVNQMDWSDSADKKLVLNPGAVDLLAKIRKHTTLSFADVVRVKRGVLFDKELLTPEKTSAQSHLYFEGGVYRYEMNRVTNRWIEYGEKMRERPKEFEWFEGSRILLRRLVNRQQRLMATLAADTFVTNKNLYTILSARTTPEVILGVLNSRLISFLYVNQVAQATKDDFPQVTIKDLAALPFPELDAARHDQMVKFVERMLELHRQEAANETARERIAREIAITDEKIDALVYELYGLTREEIGIVEGQRNGLIGAQGENQNESI